MSLDPTRRGRAHPKQPLLAIGHVAAVGAEVDGLGDRGEAAVEQDERQRGPVVRQHGLRRGCVPLA